MTVILGVVSLILLALALRVRVDRPVPATFEAGTEAGVPGGEIP